VTKSPVASKSLLTNDERGWCGLIQPSVCPICNGLFFMLALIVLSPLLYGIKYMQTLGVVSS